MIINGVEQGEFLYNLRAIRDLEDLYGGGNCLGKLNFGDIKDGINIIMCGLRYNGVSQGVNEDYLLDNLNGPWLKTMAEPAMKALVDSYKSLLVIPGKKEEKEKK